MIKIAPSILSADFSRLGEELSAVEAAGADLIHVDVMDGHFVPNITMGPLVLKAIRKSTKLKIDVHLMIEDPDKYIPAFAKEGADIISFHAEAVPDPVKTIELIKMLGKVPALAINPDTDTSVAEKLIASVGMVLLMSVFPGFEGQTFMPEVLPKIRKIKEAINKSRSNADIEVDGGINSETARQVINAGANILVAGSAVYYSADYKKAIADLRGIGA